MDNSYAVELLQINLYEWKAVKHKNNQNIAMHGPSQYACEAVEEANQKIMLLEAAIKILTNG